MGEADFRSVLNEMRLPNDLAWTIPIVLDVDRKTADRPQDRARRSSCAAEDGRPVAILHLEEKYGFDKGGGGRKDLRDAPTRPIPAWPRSWA